MKSLGHVAEAKEVGRVYGRRVTCKVLTAIFLRVERKLSGNFASLGRLACE